MRGLPQAKLSHRILAEHAPDLEADRVLADALQLPTNSDSAEGHLFLWRLAMEVDHALDTGAEFVHW